jgi:ubiquitin-conjugating enzyme E2 I
MLKWNCEIPGPKGTIWEAGFYKLVMEFPMDYPIRPPKCKSLCFRPI